ncbi:MAG: hypothetical protein LLG14_02105 [Nocardiaceae bacterium]|nr:hypothetical protein [Nocardiaceae bacterium]
MKWLGSAAAAGFALTLAACSSSGPDVEQEHGKSLQSEVSATSSSAAASSSANAPRGASTAGSPVIVFDYRSEDADRTYYKFSTPGNAESCVISVRKGDTESPPESNATCVRKDAVAHQGSCDASHATGAVVTSTRANYSCDAALGDFKTLEYGDSIDVHGFKCISENAKITCHFSEPGFTLTRDNVTLY